jgi:uncharacterized protein YwbE
LHERVHPLGLQEIDVKRGWLTGAVRAAAITRAFAAPHGVKEPGCPTS